MARVVVNLFACVCNQPQRLAEALAPVRRALVAEPPVSRWGMGYLQGGDALLVRTPKASAQPIDLAGTLFEQMLPGTDCAIAAAVRDTPGVAAPAGTDNTPPFRFRRWIFAQSGQLELADAAPRLLAHVPEYLRRNVRGRTSGELVFHLLLATLHDGGAIEDPHLQASTVRRALASTLKLVGAALPSPTRLGNIALANGRVTLCARLSDDEPMRIRRLWVPNDRGERDPGFRGVLVVSGAVARDAADAAHANASSDGFEDLGTNTCVLISRDLQFQLGDLAL